MTSKQFRRALLQIGLHSYSKAAAALGVSRRSVIRYSCEQAPVPPYVARLVEMFMRHGIPQEYQR